MTNYFLRSQAFFPYLNAAGYDFVDFDRFSEAKDGVAKKKLQKNECLEHYMESFQKKVGTIFYSLRVYFIYLTAILLEVFSILLILSTLVVIVTLKVKLEPFQ